MISFLAVLLLNVQPASVAGHDVGVRAVQAGGHIALEYFVVDESRAERVVALSTSHPAAGVTDPLLTSFFPTRITSAKVEGTRMVLSGNGFECMIAAPGSGHVFAVSVTGSAPRKSLSSAVFGLALAPGSRPAAAQSFFGPPGGPQSLATTERFATPLALAVGGGYAIGIMPDVVDLETNRPLPPALLYRNAGRANAGAVLAYGFVPYERDADWAPKLADRTLNNPDKFDFRFDLLVAPASVAVGEADAHLWSRYGEERAKKPLPQVVPFRYYTKPTYALEAGGGGEEEEEGGGGEAENHGLWWTKRDSGREIRAPKGADGLAKLTDDGNIARFAWGLRWWGDRLLQDSWSEHADEVMALVASAPQGATALDLASGQWKVNEQDRASEAITARWKLAYADSFFSTFNDRLIEQAVKSAQELMKGDLDGVTALLLQDVSRSSSITDAAVKRSAQENLDASRAKLVALADGKGFQPPSIETASLALVLARSNDAESKAAAKRLLESLFLYQAVWQPVTVSGTEVFGGFVGDHFIEEAQSGFTADLLAAAVALDDVRLSQRALASLRAPLALFNHQAHGISGMVLPSTIGLLRSSAWFGTNGQAAFGEWRGVAEGIGQTLTSAALAIKQFGSYYRSAEGWSLGIDGLEDGGPLSAFARNPIAFEGSFPYEIFDAGSGLRTTLADPGSAPAMRSMVLEQDDKGLVAIVLPGFTVLDAQHQLKGEFLFSDGTRADAGFFPTGLGVRVTEDKLLRGPVAFIGTYTGARLEVAPTVLLASPPPAEAAWPMGWRRMQGMSDVTAATLTVDGVYVVSTADDGDGARDESLTGLVESQVFLLTKRVLKFTMLGKKDANVRIELVDATMGVPVMVVQKKSDQPEDVVWDLPRMVSSRFFVRLVDESKTGSVDVVDLRAEDGADQKRMP